MKREKIRTIQINLKRCSITEREVKPSGNKKMKDGRIIVSSGKVYVRPYWIGKTVIVVLKDGN